ncbi:MAG: hypothetical protein EOM05_08120 [Clostridia bacterium]|nr:hypothetical protein [Clostridia bacterium]
MKNRTKIISIIIAAVIIIVGGAFGYTKYEANLEKKAIETSLNGITSTMSNFDKETNREKKLAILKELTKEKDTYSKNENAVKEVKDSYNNKVKAMNKYFTDEYDRVISENTIEDAINCNSKDTLNTSITNLTEVLALVKSDKTTRSKGEAPNRYETTINTLITTYQNQVNSIESAEKAAAEKAQAEADKAAAEKAKEEAAKKSSTTTSPSTSTNRPTTTKATSSNKASVPSVKPGMDDPAALAEYLAAKLGIRTWKWGTSEEMGTFIIIDVDTGKTYDENGVYLCNIYTD